nr:hypothetical protein Iba_chr11bCG14160 [Ipomoea batatas]
MVAATTAHFHLASLSSLKPFSPLLHESRIQSFVGGMLSSESVHVTTGCRTGGSGSPISAARRPPRPSNCEFSRRRTIANLVAGFISYPFAPSFSLSPHELSKTAEKMDDDDEALRLRNAAMLVSRGGETASAKVGWVPGSPLLLPFPQATASSRCPRRDLASLAAGDDAIKDVDDVERCRSLLGRSRRGGQMAETLVVGVAQRRDEEEVVWYSSSVNVIAFFLSIRPSAVAHVFW